MDQGSAGIKAVSFIPSELSLYKAAVQKYLLLGKPFAVQDKFDTFSD
jgi:hypothetical protein